MRRIIFDNLLEETKARIKREVYNLTKADMEEKQKPVGGIEKRIVYRNTTILVGYTIQFLPVVCRFLVGPGTIFPLPKLPPTYPVEPEVNPQLSKVQVGIFRDNTTNKQWRNEKWAPRAGQVGSLVVEDKKPKLEDDGEPKDITANIHYTDSYGSIAKESNLWFLDGFTTKDTRRAMADGMAGQHRTWKIDALADHTEKLREYKAARMLWEWKLVRLAWKSKSRSQAISWPIRGTTWDDLDVCKPNVAEDGSQFYHVEDISDVVNMQKANTVGEETFAPGFL